MYVCLCHAVTDTQIKEAVSQGDMSLADVKSVLVWAVNVVNVLRWRPKSSLHNLMLNLITMKSPSANSILR